MSWCRSATAAYGSVAAYFRGDLGGDPVAIRRIKEFGVGSNTPASSGGYSINTPYAITTVCTSATDCSVWLGTTETNSAVSVAFPTITPDRMGCGHLVEVFSVDNGMVGVGQQFAFWDVALSDDEVISLAKGFSPRRVRPQSLKFYWPALRSLKEWKSGSDMSVQGTEASVADHLRTYGM